MPRKEHVKFEKVLPYENFSFMGKLYRKLDKEDSLCINNLHIVQFSPDKTVRILTASEEEDVYSALATLTLEKAAAANMYVVKEASIQKLQPRATSCTSCSDVTINIDYECPSCNQYLSMVPEANFCPNCGAPLDWSKRPRRLSRVDVLNEIKAAFGEEKLRQIVVNSINDIKEDGHEE